MPPARTAVTPLALAPLLALAACTRPPPAFPRTPAPAVPLAPEPAAPPPSAPPAPPSAPPAPRASAAVRYADLGAAACFAELSRQRIPWRPVAGGARGVLAPIRLAGPVGGVTFRTELPEKERATSPYELMDCRLALALASWTELLRARGIDEVTMFSSWRPPPRSWPEGKEAEKHPGGMAIDVRRLHWGGEWRVVERDFHGRIKDVTCGPGATPPRTDVPEAHALRELVCATAQADLFTTILTPNHDRPHANHLHLDLRPHARWRMVE